MQNIWHQYLAIVVYSVFVCYLLFFLLWWQWKDSLCWYDDRISFVLSWWQGKAVFVVMMTGKTGSNIPVGPEPASALIRRSTTMLTCRARYSDIQNTTFTIFTLSDIFWGTSYSDIQLFNTTYLLSGLVIIRRFCKITYFGLFTKTFYLYQHYLCWCLTHVKDCERSESGYITNDAWRNVTLKNYAIFTWLFEEFDWWIDEFQSINPLFE